MGTNSIRRKSKHEELSARAFGSEIVNEAEASNDMVGGCVIWVRGGVGLVLGKFQGCSAKLRGQRTRNGNCVVPALPPQAYLAAATIVPMGPYMILFESINIYREP